MRNKIVRLFLRAVRLAANQTHGRRRGGKAAVRTGQSGEDASRATEKDRRKRSESYGDSIEHAATVNYCIFGIVQFDRVIPQVFSA